MEMPRGGGICPLPMQGRKEKPEKGGKSPGDEGKDRGRRKKPRGGRKKPRGGRKRPWEKRKAQCMEEGKPGRKGHMGGEGGPKVEDWKLGG
jgi:hypothetical protein